jgi:uncharacterized iron-regulated protein
MTPSRAVVATVAVAVAFLSIAPAAAQYVPERVYSTANGGFSDFESMLADAAKADVLFVGEQHDDPNTHRLERAVLEGLLRRRTDVVLSLEMFERDVQQPLDRFVTGETGEAEFLSASRPWPRYATDYKPLVDFAAAHKWPVVAANVPRPLASEVSKGGLTVLDAKTGEARQWFARELQCPTDDEYYDRFTKAMGGHAPGGAAPAAGTVASSAETLTRYYQSQCLKDETMAESIAQARQSAASGAAPLVVHVNGAFHSDFGLGTAARVRRRLPGARVVIITVMPVADLDTLAPGDEDRQRADYLVYTLKKQV